MLYIIAVILGLVTVISAIAGWRLRSNFLQYTSMYALFFICVALFYQRLIELGRSSEDNLAGVVTIGLLSLFVVIGIAGSLYEYLATYSANTKKATPISLDDFNNYVRINPKVWDIKHYTLLNHQLDVYFTTTFWEWLILHFCKLIRVDAKTTTMNDLTYQKLCEHVQEDIKEKREENRRQMEKSLNAINENRQTQNDLLISYSQQIENIKKDL